MGYSGGSGFFLSQKYTEAGFTQRNTGIGDLYIRTKWRMINDTEAGTAFAVMPYVKIPTNSGGVGNRSVEGGLILPWTVTLPGAFNLATMAEMDFLRNDSDNGYDTVMYASASLSRQVTKVVGLYAEATAGKSSGRAAWKGTLGAGVTVVVTDAIWWDFAVYRGVSRSAIDWNPVIRFNWGF